MLGMTLGRKLRALNDMDDSGSEAKGFKCCGWLWVINKKNDSGSWAQSSKWIANQDAFQRMMLGRGYSQVARMMKMKHLRDVKDTNNSESWAQGLGCHEWLWVMMQSVTQGYDE